MPTELINRPTIVLPEDTAEGDALRLADALNTHGVAGVVRQLDAVARLMQGLQEPAPPLRPPRTDNDTRRCGQLTRTGKTCRRHLPCFWHQPADEAANIMSVTTADQPVAAPDAELSPKPPEGVSQRAAGQKPAVCPKCGAPAGSICREQLPGGVMAWKCQPCGWREELPQPAAA